MKKSSQLFAALATAGMTLGALSGAARAEDPPSLAYSWTITAASDYIFRGISYTQSAPTVNSYLEFTYGIGYVALWTSNIDTCDGPGCLGPWEQDIYVGIRPVTGPINWDLAVYYYMYGTEPGSTVHSDDVDYVELKATASTTPITNLTLTGTVFYTPDQDLASPENISVEGTVAYTLPAIGIFTPTISGQVGFSDASTNDTYGTASTPNPVTGFGGYWNGDDKYTYWNAGVKFAVEKFTFDFRYWDTNVNEAVALDPNNSDERFFFSAAVTLP